jgi:hypothetical protein
MTSQLSELFSFAKLPKTPLHEQPTASYDVFRTTHAGKKQPRKLSLTKDGIRNLAGSSVRWHVGKKELIGCHRESPASTTFTLTTVHRFQFDAQSPEQLEQIFKSLAALGLGNEEMSKAVDEATVFSCFLHSSSSPLFFVC